MDLMLMMAIGAAAMLAGLVGCFLPVIPGPAIAYASLFALFAFGCPLTTTQLTIGAGVLIVVTLVDYILPSVCAKPLGIVLGPFLGTIAGELIAGKNLAASVRGGFGALLGFVLCLGLKLAAVGLYAWWYFARLPDSS